MSTHRISVRGIAGGSSSASVTLRVRTDLSLQHLSAAALFSRQSYAIEQMPTGSPAQTNGEHFSYTMSSVISAAFFLEATINQFFIDLVESNGQWSNSFSQANIATAKYLWELQTGTSLERSNAIGKYMAAAVILEKIPYSAADPIISDANLIFSLRDAFAHAKPEWDAAGPTYSKLTKRLNALIKSRAISPNPLVPSSSRFPHLHFGHSLTEWAIQRAVALVTDFFARMQIQDPYAARIAVLQTR